MALETRKERILYLGVVPVVGAVLGALATAVFQISQAPAFDLPTPLEIMRDPNLSAADKKQLLELAERVSGRPWDVIQSIMTLLFMALGGFIGAFGGAIADRIRDKK